MTQENVHHGSAIVHCVLCALGAHNPSRLGGGWNASAGNTLRYTTTLLWYVFFPFIFYRFFWHVR